MRNILVLKTLSTAILLTFATASQADTDTSRNADSKTISALPETARPVAHSLPAENMLDLLSADNTAQIHLQQKDISDPNGICDYVECDKRNASIAVKFSKLQLSDGAYLEVLSREDDEVLRYDARDIATVTQRTGGVFTTSYVKGDSLTLRLVYPEGTVPEDRDIAVPDTLLTLFNYWDPNLTDTARRNPVACLKKGTAAEQLLYNRSLAIGYAPATTWLAGTGNYLLTNNHVLGEDGKIKAGDYIPDRSVLFNYESPDCTDNKAAATRDNLVNIRAGQLVSTGGSAGSSTDWTLFTLDPLEYREAAVKTVFGGLALDDENMQQGQMFSAIGHGRAAQYFEDSRVADPQQGSAKQISNTGTDGKPCSVHSISPEDFSSNCYVTGGNSGSPAFSADGKVAGMMRSVSAYSYGLPAQHLRKVLTSWAEQGKFEKAVDGQGHVRSAHIELPAFARSSDITFNETGLSFAPVVEGRRFTHKAGYSLLKSVARDNRGKEVDVMFRLAQDNSCGVANLSQICTGAGPTTLKVWLDREENAASIPVGNSVTGWLPVAVKSHGQLIANQMLRYRYTHYIPQESPFTGSGKPVIKMTLTDTKNYLSVMDHNDFRSGVTAVRSGEGPLADTAEGTNTTGIPYSGTTKLFSEVTNQQNGQRYTMTLRGGLINSCSKKADGNSGGWTPVNSSACETSVPGRDNFTSGRVFVLKQDNAHLPAGHYTGLLPLMIRHWDFQDAKPVEVSIDYQMK